ncbi:MAG: ABC transporter ATP-binding protein [Gammaproteobacteria bacterium]|nr:ABC transporter ATP-binding protein [Gammaproteobacteria bacterium]
MTVEKGEIRAIIGPNGAGKTTLVGLISGRLHPDEGRVFFKGEDITARPVWDRVQAGIVYTFQVTSIFRSLSCYENVALAAQRRLARGFVAQLCTRERRIRAAAMAMLEAVGLSAEATRTAGTLPYGHQRLLEVAMSLALEPELLILDEPTQGLAQSEIDGLSERVRHIAKTRTVLLIEHNMPVVLALADQITVLDNGAVLANGSPAQIEADHAVQQAYLGV